MDAKSLSGAIGPGRPAWRQGARLQGARLQGTWIQTAAVLLVAAALMAACQPTVKVEAPKDPITINLNIQADVRVTLEEKAKEDIAANPGVF